MPAAGLVYAVVTALLFRDLLPNLGTHLYSDLGDSLLNTSVLAWNARELPLTGDWWNFPGYGPFSGVTAFTEHLLLLYPITTPVIWLTGNPVLAYNVAYLLALPLNGIAAYVLARELTGSTVAAFIGGLAFAFSPYQTVHISHIQTLMAFGMPMGLLGLHRYLGAGGRRALVLFAGGWLITAASNAYALVFFPLLVAMWCAWQVRPREWRRVATVAIAAVIAMLPLVPVLWGYHVRLAAYQLERRYVETTLFAADITGLANVFHQHAVWRGVLPVSYEEGAQFPGATILALAVVAVTGAVGCGFTPRRGGPQGPAPRTSIDRLTRASRWLLLISGVSTAIVLLRVWTGPFGWHFGPIPLPPLWPYRLFTAVAALFLIGVVLSDRFRQAWARRDHVVFLAMAVVVLWLLSLGPEPEWSTPWRAMIYGPYRLFMELPGANNLRVPARAWIPAVLCLAMLASHGAGVVISRYRHAARALVGTLGALIVIEGWFVAPIVRVPSATPGGMIPDGALVLDLPMDEAWKNTVPQYRAVLGGYRTINGYSGYEPPYFTSLRHEIAERRPDALERYRRLADLYIILRPGEHPDVARWIANYRGGRHLLDIDDAAVYRLPRLEGATPGVIPVPMPNRGEPPFRLP
jgi:hypothetical protein